MATNGFKLEIDISIRPCIMENVCGAPWEMIAQRFKDEGYESHYMAGQVVYRCTHNIFPSPVFFLIVAGVFPIDKVILFMIL